jgi:hypothetical protein
LIQVAGGLLSRIARREFLIFLAQVPKLVIGIRSSAHAFDFSKASESFFAQRF